MPTNKRQTKSHRTPAMLGLAALVVVIIAAIIVRGHGSKTAALSSPSPSPTPVLGRTTNDEPKTTPTPVPPITSLLAKPTLTKSSGNAPGSSVPAGALIEFTCEGTAGASCQIVLQSQTSPATKITLDAKPVADNGRGQFFALWDWKAVAGSWIVTSVTSASGQASTTSDSQTLEVK